MGEATENCKLETPCPPSLSFTTFRSALQALREHGLPETIGPDLWSHVGDERDQVLDAFRFLGLADSEGCTQSALHKLAACEQDSDEEKEVLSGILRQRYPRIFELNLRRATITEVSEAMTASGGATATVERAVKFFIKAANYCNIELSVRLGAGLRERPLWMRANVTSR